MLFESFDEQLLPQWIPLSLNSFVARFISQIKRLRTEKD